MEEENFLSKALRIISEEAPKFFSEMNVPFLGKDEDRSVMRPTSSGQQEKEIVELLLGGGAVATIGVGSGMAKTVASVLGKHPTLTSAITALGLQDPTAMLSGPIGAADAISSLTGGGGSIKDAEAAFRTSANSMLSRRTIDNILSWKESGRLTKSLFTDQEDARLSMALYDKLTSKEASKYGTPEFFADPYLNSTRFSPEEMPSLMKKVDIPVLLDSDEALVIKAANKGKIDLQKRATPGRMENPVYAEETNASLQRYNNMILDKGRLFEDFDFANKQNKILLHSDRTQAANDVLSGIGKMSGKMRDLGISNEDIEGKSLQQIKTMVAKKEEETIRVLKKSQSKRNEIVINRTKELMDNQADLSNMKYSEFVKLESPKDLAQETDVLNHCLGACDRSNDKYIPAFDTVTGESYRKSIAGSSYEEYKRKLESGESEFFSFRPKGLPQFTIEVDYTTRNNGRIVQAYGAEDRRLTEEELGILKDFAVSRDIDTSLFDAPFGWGGI